MTMTRTWSNLVQIAVGAAILASLTALAWTGSLSSGDAYNLLLALVGLLGGVGLWILASNVPNAGAIPHAALAVLTLASVTVHGIHGTLSATQVQGMWGLLILGTSVPAGATLGRNIVLSSLAPTAAAQQRAAQRGVTDALADFAPPSPPAP